MKIKRIFLCCSLFGTLLFGFFSFANTNTNTQNFAERTEVKEFITQMSKKHKFDQNYLTNLFSKFNTSKKIIELISKPYEGLAWWQYKKTFLSKQRIQKGLEFLEKNKQTLKTAEKKFGVPAEIITAIIGVETFYGKNKGNFPILESLLTLSFDYPRRANFFKKELEEFLLLARDAKLNPKEIKGSYAGAIGIAQFMPSSYRNYAVNLNEEKNPDIINNFDNAIASTANYLKIHGWKPKTNIAHRAYVKGKSYKKFVNMDKIEKPKFSLDFLIKNDISTKKYLNNSENFSLIELEAKDNKKIRWITENNFYVITRYNRSYNYAMAVYQLAKEIKKLKLHNDDNATS